MIVKSAKHNGGYYIDGRFVLLKNWKLNKPFFTPDEQTRFENFIKNNHE